MILECTLRDGGYYTHWEFDNDLVQEMVSVLSKSKVDYIELGYKSPLPGGRFRKCNDNFISQLLKNVSYDSRLAFMIDAKDFIENNKVDVASLNPGIYIFSIRINDENKFSKFIKK